MGPAGDRRDDQRVPDVCRVVDGAAMEPPVIGGTTPPCWAQSVAAIMPQWSPPLDGGSTGRHGTAGR